MIITVGLQTNFLYMSELSAYTHKTRVVTAHPSRDYSTLLK